MGIIELKLRTVCIFCGIAIVCGVILFVIAGNPYWPERNLALSLGLAWIVAGGLLLILLFKWFYLDQKMKRRKNG